MIISNWSKRIQNKKAGDFSPAFLFMCFFVQVFFIFVYGFCYRAIAPLFTQAFQTGQDTVNKERLFLFDAGYIIFMMLPDFLDFPVLLALLIHPANHFGKIGNKRNNRADDCRSSDNALPC